VRPRTDRDDACPAGGRECAMQSGGQCEVAEMIGGELELPTLRRSGQRAGHDPGIVDQDVHRLVPRGDERRDRCRVGEVNRRDQDVGVAGGGLDLRGDALSRVGGADREGHLCTRGGECARGFEADAGCPTGHDDPTAGQVDSGDDLCGGGSPLEGCGDRCGLSHAGSRVLPGEQTPVFIDVLRVCSSAMAPCCRKCCIGGHDRRVRFER
jgi:hypothetical protein